jgi:lipid II:glycine glycyltransferase (peptidoglycan interpeptide bridge formation enzyme)
LGPSFFKEFFEHAVALNVSLPKGTPMIVHWDGHDLAQWDAVYQTAAGALQQAWDYGSSLKLLGVPVLRARVLDEGQQIAQAQFIVRKWGKLGAVALCTRGPIWSKTLTPENESLVYKALKKTLPLKGIRFMAITPEVAEGQAHGLHPMRRIMSGMSTVMLDISLPMSDIRAQLEGRWRTSLVGAEASEMKVHRVGTNEGQYRWLLDTEKQQRVDKHLEGLPIPFFDMYVQSRKQPAKNILTLRSDLGRDRIAAMMFLIHGEAATYQVGWTSDQGRELNAHHLILWRAIEELRERGIRVLDLGGVNTIRSAGVARFKMRTGGKILTLAGTYI